MKKSGILFLLLFTQLLWAQNKTNEFYKVYNSKSTSLSSAQLKQLRKTKIIYIPGILAETFQEDPRSVLNLSFITKEYFGTQVNYLKNNYQLDVTRLKTSSKTLAKTKRNIRLAIKKAKQEKKQVLFVAHSLGGLALTEVLIELKNPQIVQGVVFLQTPFWGSPIATVYDNNTYYIKKVLRPLLPFFNTSEEIITYLKQVTRMHYMHRNQLALTQLNKAIPIISVVSKANDSFTLFEAAVNIMEYGCLSVIRGKCLTNTIYYGRKDQSDGMVPINSGLYPDANYIVLKNVDHGETVVNLGPFNISRTKMIDSILQILQAVTEASNN